MSQAKEISQVLGDYALCIRALLPETRAVICHDEHGRILWQTKLPSGSELPAELGAVVHQLLAAESEADVSSVVPGSALTAHVLRLNGQNGRGLGTLSILLDSARKARPPAEIAGALKPAIRNLQRDLNLRLRLAEAQKRVALQTAEETLLHDVEQVVHERRGCESLLRDIVSLCHKHLGVGGVVLMMPDKRIGLVQGDAISRQDAERIAQSLPPTLDDSGVIEGPADLKAVRGDLLCMPLLQGGRIITGVLAMANWEASGFSERRRARVARYVASHIEFVINRNYDPLTGLIAWPVFERELREAKAGNNQESDVCTVMYFDIDRLHVVNESMGRDCGDEILTRFAVLARDNLAGHSVSRIASDSFAALLRGIPPEAAQAKAQAICDGFRELVYTRGNQTFRPSVSIGVGLLGSAEESGGPLATAEVACKAAKDRGRGRVELYEDGDKSIVRRLDDIQLIGFVRSAIENDRLHLMAQPIVSLRPGATARYYEILVRMIGAGGKHLAPSEFMSTAERYQMMEELDRWVVSRSLNMIGAKSAELHAADLRFAINLSGQSLGSEHFLPFVMAELERTKVPPGMISFEITESVAVTRMQQAQNLMHSLQRAGCKFALDDFGTGLASFAYLKLFPVNTLKIDGSFIRDVVTNVVSQSMVAAISEVARVMNLETVAEFVQDDAALQLLRDLGITWAQGYLLGVPEPLTQVINARAVEATSTRRSAQQQA
jgi:diguanylate cyclase (GGDEF)-like protein